MATDTLIDIPRRVARVLVEQSLPHLDRLFDYEVPESMDESCVPGCRVQVRFAGVKLSGFVVERATSSEFDSLQPILKVVSPVPVLTPAIHRLARAIADHCGGTEADVVRSAIPPRHATTEKAVCSQEASSAPAVDDPAPAVVLPSHPTGQGYLTALAAGGSPRAAWSVVPVSAQVGRWASGFVEAALAARASGRTSLLLVPDHKDVSQIQAVADTALGRGRVAILTAEQGPAARYRAFLRALRGDVDVVIGTRAALYAPLPRLGLIALFDDGDDLWADPRAPYAHGRDMAVLRASQQGCALLLAARSRTAEVQQLVERGWLGELALSADDVRRLAPVVHAMEPERRLPRRIFPMLRAGLAAGPVLVQIPHAGFRSGLLCDGCREPVRCPSCRGQIVETATGHLRCRLCGTTVDREHWRCPSCEHPRSRGIVVGAERQVDELRKAFPETTVLDSSGDHVVVEIAPEPALVVATPGAEPHVEGGYAMAVLLDADSLLTRPWLRAAEEARRRWLTAVSLVRPPRQNGTVVIVGDPGSRAVQALVRHDATGFAERELDDRRSAHMSPAAKIVVVEGSERALDEFAAQWRAPTGVEVFGPVPAPRRGDEDPAHRLLCRAPLADSAGLIASLKDVVADRTAAKRGEPVRLRVDPLDV